MRYWIGTALLAGSWLLGLDYFYPANPYGWLAAVFAGVVLLGSGKPSQRTIASASWQIVTILLLLPAAWFAAWPYRGALLLIAVGLAGERLPLRKRWGNWLASGAVTAGVIMLVQGLVLEVYATTTARSHELPWPLPDLLAGIATLLGIDAAADGSNVVIHSMRQVHRLGTTWELLLDPATLLFFFGGATMLAVCDDSQAVDGSPPEWRKWISDLRWLAIVLAAWLPVRVGLMMAVYLQRVLSSEPDHALHAMNHLFSPWVLTLLLGVPVLLAWWFIGTRDRRAVVSAPSVPPSPFLLPHSSFIIRRGLPLAAMLIAVAVAIFTLAVAWCPCGERRAGRVMVVERHSKWEPTTKPYDTKWFVEPELFPDVNSGYNYARIYRYLDQYFDMSRLFEKDKIDDSSLEKCDVLVIKTPTERYSPEEVAAVQRFVEKGGGLLLIGDHTNYARSATIMNDVVRPMGFIFRDDLLFSFGSSPYEQLNATPVAPHPAVQHMPPMDFAVSCSIDPGHSRGRPVIENTGLWSMGPEYHSDNFHPVPRHCPEMRYGAFVQTWAARYGAGRVIAFTDSTIFSNFCAGQPGKSELMLGMVEWLNHANAWIDPRPWLFLVGLVPLAVGLWLATVGYDRGQWLVILAAGTCGWTIGSLAVIGLHRHEMPTPPCKRPERCVVIDRTTSDVPLSKGAYTQGDGNGYGLFEQWLARLDCYTVRKQGPKALSGDMLVAICPSRPVPETFRRQVEQYVADGGKLLVVDSPENVHSTANTLLQPFGLTIEHGQAWKGKLATSLGSPSIELEAALETTGGRPIAKIDTHAVAAAVRHGRGCVVAIGFGSLWNDSRMGETWMAEPDATIRTRYELLFGLVGRLFDGGPWPEFQPKPATKRTKNPPLMESGPAEL